MKFTDSLSDADFAIVCCMPVRLIPDLPQREPTLTYETMTCQCGEKCWIGSRQKKLAADIPEVRILCVFCVMRDFGAGPLENIVTMDKLKP